MRKRKNKKIAIFFMIVLSYLKYRCKQVK